MNYKSVLIFCSTISIYGALILLGVSETAIRGLILDFPLTPYYQLLSVGICVLDMIFVYQALLFWLDLKSLIYIRSKNKYNFGLRKILIQCFLMMVVRNIFFGALVNGDVLVWIYGSVGLLIVLACTFIHFDPEKRNYSLVLASLTWIAFKVGLSFL